MRIRNMHMAALSVAFTTALASGAATAQVAPVEAPSHSPIGFYAVLDLSLGRPMDSKTSAGFEADLGLEGSGGFGVGAAVGPLHLEVRHQAHTFFLNDLTPNGTVAAPGLSYGGDADVYALMVQGSWEFPTEGIIRPYVGFGAGIVEVSADYHESICSICTAGTPLVAEDDFVRAWQGTAGLVIGSGSGVEYYLGYRYFRTDDLDLSTTSGLVFSHDGLRAHSGVIGVRLSFN